MQCADGTTNVEGDDPLGDAATDCDCVDMRWFPDGVSAGCRCGTNDPASQGAFKGVGYCDANTWVDGSDGISIGFAKDATTGVLSLKTGYEKVEGGAPYCAANYRVKRNECKACYSGWERLVGDDPNGGNTYCYQKWTPQYCADYYEKKQEKFFIATVENDTDSLDEDLQLTLPVKVHKGFTATKIQFQGTDINPMGEYTAEDSGSWTVTEADGSCYDEYTLVTDLQNMLHYDWAEMTIRLNANNIPYYEFYMEVSVEEKNATEIVVRENSHVATDMLTLGPLKIQFPEKVNFVDGVTKGTPLGSYEDVSISITYEVLRQNYYDALITLEFTSKLVSGYKFIEDWQYIDCDDVP